MLRKRYVGVDPEKNQYCTELCKHRLWFHQDGNEKLYDFPVPDAIPMLFQLMPLLKKSQSS
jgi:hypothetical protein